MNFRIRSALLGAASMLIVAGLLAGCVDRDPRNDDEFANSPTPPPATQVPAQPTPSASAAPASSAGSFGRIKLTQATGNDVTIDVSDASGTLLAATSGTPGDGASVEPYKLVVANDDATTLRLTWVGGPCDSANTLSIDATRHQFLLVQPECPGDAIALDRVLILRFSQPVTAGDVQPFIQDGLDTPG